MKFGKTTELFVEYPPLVAGQAVTFTAHFTVLGRHFTPVRSGKVVVSFLAGGKVMHQILASRISRVGIFEPQGKAPAAGKVTLRFDLETPTGSDRIEWPATVYASAHDAEHRDRVPEAPGQEISFLKEQQWLIPFATAAASAMTMRAGFEVPGRLEVASGASARLTAPIAGTVTRLAAGLKIGASVAAGQVLASVEPLLLQGSDLPQLRADAVSAGHALKLARTRRDQLQRMYKVRAIARLELDRAEYEVQRTKAAARASSSRLWLHRKSRRGQSGSGHGVQLRAPFAGTVVSRALVKGAAVVAGQFLLELVDRSRLRVVARVLPADMLRARGSVGASMRSPDGRWIALAGPPVFGVSVDPVSRTVPVRYRPVTPAGLPVGSSVRVRLLGAAKQVVAVPFSAVLDSDGQAVVMVQTGGESFVLRRVGLGLRDRGWIEVTLGVRPGERVVTVGGYQLLLSTKLSGGAQLGHGHAH